jgi:NAD(P)-dependent dehydrogenase (short-subunit alcohol dehydrogenase family)
MRISTDDGDERFTKGEDMSVGALFDLKGRVSLVSGGGDGLGRAMAMALADAGSFDHHGETILARIPLTRYGNLEELGGVIVFMASAASDYITGQIIAVDGGLTAW